MNLVLKLVVLLFSYVVLWLQVHLSHKTPWSDKRTRSHRIALGLLRWVLLPATVIGSSVVIILDHRIAAVAEDRQISMADTLKRVASVVGVSPSADVAAAVENLRAAAAIQEKELTSTRQELSDLRMQADSASRAASAASAAAAAQAPRTLSSDEQQRLTTNLRNGPKGEVDLSIPMLAGGEAQAFAAVLKRVLVGAGWTIRNQAVIPFPDEASGLYLEVRSAAHAPSRAAWLQTALRDVGLTTQGRENPAVGPDDVEFIVARKP